MIGTQKVYHSLVRSSNLSSMSRIGCLGHQDRHRTKESTRGTHEESTSYEHPSAIRRSLHNHTYNQDNASKIDALLSPPPISNPRHARITHAGPECLDGIHKTKVCTAGLMHEHIPLGKSLEAIHHAVVVAHGAGEEHRTEKHEVQLEEMWCEIPWLRRFWKKLTYVNA